MWKNVRKYPKNVWPDEIQPNFSTTIDSLYNKIDTAFLNKKSIHIENPLSQDMAFLRTSLGPGILKALSYNEKRDSGFLKYYEIGSVNTFSSKKYNLSVEKRELCIGYLDDKIKSWKNKKSFDLFDVKGDLKMLLYNLGIEDFLYTINYRIPLAFM